MRETTILALTSDNIEHILLLRRGLHTILQAILQCSVVTGTIVKHATTGTCIVDCDASKYGRVPAGCHVETRIPFAEAIYVTGSPSPISSTKILSLYIVSAISPGYALME